MINLRTIVFSLGLISLSCLTLISCRSVRNFSKFSSSSISLGTTKESIIAEFGDPSKSEFWKNDTTGVFEERLYYKESFMGRAFEDPYVITNILFFVDGKLKSLTQGQEKSRNDHIQRTKEK